MSILFYFFREIEGYLAIFTIQCSFIDTSIFFYFQASRNSLDGAGLSSSSLGRKLNRPFSPTVSRKGLNPLRNSSSSPFVLKQFEDTSTNEPFVETPLSPEQEKASFEYKSSPGDTNNVEIIDITDQDFSCEIETMIQDFDTVLKRSEEDEDLLESPNLERPNHLNLGGETRKDRYAFNSKIGEWKRSNKLLEI